MDFLHCGVLGKEKHDLILLLIDTNPVFLAISDRGYEKCVKLVMRSKFYKGLYPLKLCITHLVLLLGKIFSPWEGGGNSMIVVFYPGPY